MAGREIYFYRKMMTFCVYVLHLEHTSSQYPKCSSSFPLLPIDHMEGISANYHFSADGGQLGSTLLT